MGIGKEYFKAETEEQLDRLEGGREGGTGREGREGGREGGGQSVSQSSSWQQDYVVASCGMFQFHSYACSWLH